MIYSDGYIIADQWVLIFEQESKTFFNDSIKVSMEYGENEIMEHKEDDKTPFHLKLIYNGYPEIQDPSISWAQSSNPFTKEDIEGLDILENNLKR